MGDDETVNVRYLVDDVDASIAFYTKLLDFEVLTNASSRVRRRQAGPPAAPALGTEELGRSSDGRR